MTPRWSRLHKLMAAAIVVAAGLSVTAVTPALADGWRGHGRYEHRDWRAHEWREHHAWRYYHPYRYYGYGYGYGYAYPGYYYAPPPPVYAPPSFTVVVPFR